MMWWNALTFQERDFLEMLGAFFAIALAITLGGMLQQWRKRRRR